jgi:hypothetical protein
MARGWCRDDAGSAAAPEDEETPMTEANEPDGVEQQQRVVDDDVDVEAAVSPPADPGAVPEANEADVLEQLEEVPLDDDEPR